MNHENIGETSPRYSTPLRITSGWVATRAHTKLVLSVKLALSTGASSGHTLLGCKDSPEGWQRTRSKGTRKATRKMPPETISRPGLVKKTGEILPVNSQARMFFFREEHRSTLDPYVCNTEFLDKLKGSHRMSRDWGCCFVWYPP